MWICKEGRTVYPTAPGTIAGEFDDNLYEFKIAQFAEIIRDFNLFGKVLRENIRGGKPYKCILTVSPVPLTTAVGNMYSYQQPILNQPSEVSQVSSQ